MRHFAYFAVFTLGLAAVHCSSSDEPAGAAENASDGGSSGGGSSSGQGGSSSGAASDATVTALTADQPIAPVAIAALPSGNLVMPEGSALRVVEMDLQGHVVAVNSTDYVEEQWPNEVVVDAETSRIFVGAYYNIYLHAGSVTAPRAKYLTDAEGKLSSIGWGGAPKRLWALRENLRAATMSLVRYDAATASEGGAATVLAPELPRGAYGQLHLDADNNAYVADSNTCRLVKITAAGGVSVLAGAALGEQGTCYNGGTLGRLDYVLGQGRSLGLDPSGSFLAFSDGANRALLDVQPGADGRSKASRAVVRFADGVKNGVFTTVQGSYYVLDDAAKAVLRATPN